MNNQERFAAERQRIAGLGLYSADTSKREAAISTFPKSEQDRIRKFLKRSVDSFRLRDILLSDFKRSVSELQKDFSDQFLRRINVRAFCAMVEGYVFMLKQMAHSSAELNCIPISDEDNKFLMEKEALSAGEKMKFLPFRDNLKHTFNTYAKYGNFPSAVTFADNGYRMLYETFLVRDDTMHPKRYDKFSITDSQLKQVGEANNWFINAVETLIAGQNQKLESNIKERLKF